MNLYSIILVDDEEEVRKSIIKQIDWESAGFQVVGMPRTGRTPGEDRGSGAGCGSDRYPHALYGRPYAGGENPAEISIHEGGHFFRL